MKKVAAMCLGMMLLFAITPPLIAQSGDYEVNGVVVDASGAPMVGVSIVEQGTVRGTTTDIDGRYTLAVTGPNSVVEVSFIGYKPVTRVASSADLKQVVLEEDLTSLDEVIVIGYGTVKKNDATGSVVTVKADQLNKGMVSSPADMLRGKSAGVVITSGDGAPGSKSTIRIRGGSSLNASNDPLIIIDGLPVTNDDISGVSNPLASINPSDIESYTVLKDASATAIYGSRASNGVIIITTKKGSTRDSAIPHVDVDFTASLSHNSKYVDMMSASQLIEAVRGYYGEDSNAFRALGLTYGGEQKFYDTDWQKEVYQLAQSYEGNISLTGNVNFDKAAKNAMPYRVSVGYLNQDGTLKTSNMTRETLAVSLNPQLLNKHLSVNLNAKGMNMDNRFANTDAVGAAVSFDPTKPVYDPHGLNGYSWWNNGKLGDDGYPLLTQDNYNTQAAQNPVALLNDKLDEANAKRFIGNAQIDYKIHGFEDLRVNLNLGLDYSKSNGTVDVAPGREQSMHDMNQLGSGYHKDYAQMKRTQTLEAYLAYAKTLGRHSFDVMAGYSWQHIYKSSSEQQFRADGTAPDAPNYWLKEPFIDKEEQYLVSFFGRANYSFDNRYYLTATIRRDGTSRFSNNKWGVFPSVAVGWNISNESFLKDSRVLSNLKLRLSWGETGQQDVGGLYDTLPTYVMNQLGSYYQFGDKVITPITPQGYNADLKWETTTTYNAGVDYGFLNGRIYGSVDFYYRKTTDMLNYTPIAAGANLKNYLNANIGDMENTGVEFEINAVPIETKDWNWTIGFNAAWNKNKITHLSAEDGTPGYKGVYTGGISGGTGNNCQVHQTGHPTYSFFVFQQIYDEAGKPIEGVYVDRNNDGKIDDDDRYCFKKAAPDVTLGFNTQLSWKALTLAVSAHANIGNYVYDNMSSNNELLSGAFTATNFISNRKASAAATGFVKEAQYLSDYYVRNASFLKIDNITLSYRFALGRKLSRPMSLSVFGTVQNVCTFTGYEGIDPEIYSGIDNNMYPRPRTYILGVKFNF